MRVLLPLPEEPARIDAVRLAVETAALHGGQIRGLFPIDTAGIGRLEAGAPPGAIHVAEVAERHILERLRALGIEAMEEAGDWAAREKVPFTGEVKEGDPYEEIEKAAAGCDLLVTGIASRFLFGERDRPCELPLRLMKRQVIPVLLACSPYRAVSSVVIGCGGGPRTVRATEAMARLGLWKKDCRILLVAVDDSPEGGEARLAEPRQVLSDAGYPRWEERVVAGPKEESFPRLLAEEGADAAVLGGWGKRQWADFLGHSITGRLLETRGHHLFLFQ